jgi:hypothetical protein
MKPIESSVADARFREAIAYARERLEPPVRRESAWPSLAAAAFFAVCALSFAMATITAPPIKLDIPISAPAP